MRHHKMHHGSPMKGTGYLAADVFHIVGHIRAATIRGPSSAYPHADAHRMLHNVKMHKASSPQSRVTLQSRYRNSEKLRLGADGSNRVAHT